LEEDQNQFSHTFYVFIQVCQIFLGDSYQNGGKYMHQITNKYTKWPYMYIIPNVLKIDLVALKYSNPFHCKTLKNIYPKWDVWSENVPSGNPVFIVHFAFHPIFVLSWIVCHELPTYLVYTCTCTACYCEGD
jgi:hypothetical protein